MLTFSIRNVDRLEDGLPTMFTLDRRDALIGRSTACDWVLPDPDHHISGRHCQILYCHGAYVLKDISTNGTFLDTAADGLDGEHVIADGDLFRIGHYQIVATLSDDPAPAEAEPDVPAAAAAAAPDDEVPLVAGRYRLDDLIGHGALFETFRATDIQLDRQALVRLTATDAKPRDKAQAVAHFARWREFARHRIFGMPAILAQSAETAARPWMVVDLADAAPLESLLATDMVRTFRPWLLDRILCDVLRTLSEIHARKLVHGNLGLTSILVSSTTGAVFLTDPVPEGAVEQPFTASADIAALGRLLEDAAWRIGSTPRAVIGWMTAPDEYRPTAAELLETVGLGMQAIKPVFAPSDPALPPTDRVMWSLEKPAAPAAPVPVRPPPQEEPGPTRLIPPPGFPKS